MAPGRPVLSVGIQPQIALYSVILGSVCALSWYTEKYRRDEGDLDERIQKMYLQTAQESQSKMPQMAAAIRGQTMGFDGRMDKMVWGGKAQLNQGSNNSNNNNGTEGILSIGAADEEDGTIVENSSDDEEKRPRKRRKRKRKKHNTKLESNRDEQQKKEEMELKQQRTKLAVQSSIAGVAVGAISVAAVSALLAGGGRK